MENCNLTSCKRDAGEYIKKWYHCEETFLGKKIPETITIKDALAIPVIPADPLVAPPPKPLISATFPIKSIVVFMLCTNFVIPNFLFSLF